MRVYLKIDGECLEPLAQPEAGAPVVQFDVDCPSCKARRPIEVRGRGIGRHDRDTHYATAEHAACGSELGMLCCEVDTIFGIEEDERVLLHGRARVY